MSTRSFIAVKSGNGYKAIYCHFDGYFTGVGTTLADYYTNAEKVNALIALGDISVLDRELEPKPGQVHTFENRAKGVTLAYGRDRGEEGTETRFYANYKALISGAYDYGAEYVYIFTGKGWKGCHLSHYETKGDKLSDFKDMEPDNLQNGNIAKALKLLSSKQHPLLVSRTTKHGDTFISNGAVGVLYSEWANVGEDLAKGYNADSSNKKADWVLDQTQNQTGNATAKMSLTLNGLEQLLLGNAYGLKVSSWFSKAPNPLCVFFHVPGLDRLIAVDMAALTLAARAVAVNDRDILTLYFNDYKSPIRIDGGNCACAIVAPVLVPEFFEPDSKIELEPTGKSPYKAVSEPADTSTTATDNKPAEPTETPDKAADVATERQINYLAFLLIRDKAARPAKVEELRSSNISKSEMSEMIDRAKRDYLSAKAEKKAKWHLEHDRQTMRAAA